MRLRSGTISWRTPGKIGAATISPGCAWRRRPHGSRWGDHRPSPRAGVKRTPDLRQIDSHHGLRRRPDHLKRAERNRPVGIDERLLVCRVRADGEQRLALMVVAADVHARDKGTCRRPGPPLSLAIGHGHVELQIVERSTQLRQQGRRRPFSSRFSPFSPDSHSPATTRKRVLRALAGYHREIG